VHVDAVTDLMLLDTTYKITKVLDMVKPIIICK